MHLPLASVHRRTWASWSDSQRILAVITTIGALWAIGSLKSSNNVVGGTTATTISKLFVDTPPCKLSPVGEPICGEPADLPCPRTLYSSRTIEQYTDWFKFHAELLESDTSTNTYYSPQLNLIGDSITESWRGTSMGGPCERCRGIPAVRDAFFGDPAILAIAGDQTQHLLYRLQVARHLLAQQTNTDTVFVVLIGTNNLGAGYSVDATTAGIVAIVDELLNTSASNHILLLQLLPRADDSSKWKPKTLTEHGKTFQEVVDAVNAQLVAYPPLQTNERVSLVNCNKPLSNERGTANLSLMPDGLHPNARGGKLLAQCIVDCWKEKKCG